MAYEICLLPHKGHRMQVMTRVILVLIRGRVDVQVVPVVDLSW